MKRLERYDFIKQPKVVKKSPQKAVSIDYSAFSSDSKPRSFAGYAYGPSEAITDNMIQGNSARRSNPAGK
jgi:hypothetical protein